MDSLKAIKKRLLSLFSNRNINSVATDTAKPTIENQADLETTNHITNDIAEKLVREIVEDAINVLRSNIEDRIEKSSNKLLKEFEERVANTIQVSGSILQDKIEKDANKLFKEFEGKVENAINVSSSGIEDKIEKSTKNLFKELEERVADAIHVSGSNIEDKTEKNTNRLFSEFNEKIESNNDKVLSNLRAEYKKQTEDLLNTIKPTSLVKRINIYFIGIGASLVIIIIFLSLLSFSRINSTEQDIAKPTIESHADLETTEYITKDFAEKLIREKVEGAINISLANIEGRLEESTDKLLNKFDEKTRLNRNDVLANLQAEYKKQSENVLNTTKNNESSKSADTDEPVIVTTETVGGNPAEYDDTQIQTDNQHDFEDWYNKGLNELVHSNYSVAILFFSNAIKLNPENHNAYYKRGDAYFSLKNYEKAIDDFNKTIELDPENVVAFGRRGDAYDKLKQYEKAIEDYNKGIDRNPLYAPAYNNRGNTYYFIGQYEKAIKDYNRTIELDPENVVVYSNLGVAYSGLEQYGKAIENYNNVSGWHLKMVILMYSSQK